MKLYIIRHAEAVPRGSKYSEARRPLTPKGRAEFVEVVKGLKRLGVRLDRIYHSPWLRASQTADILIAILKGEAESSLDLTQSPTPEFLKHLKGESIAVVGHQPWLGELAALSLLNDPTRAARFELEKGGVAALDGFLRPGRMSLVGLWTPALLTRIKKSKAT